MCPGWMKAGRQQAHWSQLPSNLWATIFSCVMPKSAMLPGDISNRQSRLFQLRLVCRTFNKIFDHFGHLNSHVFVSKRLQSCHLPSLVGWLQHHQAHVKRLDVQHDSPWLESMLVALRSPRTCLGEVYVGATVPSTALFLLSTFQSITECALQSSQTVSVDLQPLSALPQLANLCLQHGCFSGLGAVPHLTALSLYEATAICTQDCCCVTSLVELDLYATQLIRFHHRNVGACSNLQSLTLRESYISAVDDEETFDLLDDEDNVPSGLSALTALTSLQLDFPSSHMLDWVTSFSALQSFFITAKEVIFPPSWNNMTSLKNFFVDLDRAGRDSWDSSQSNAFFEFDWCNLLSLETLQLNYVVLSEESMSGIASLQHLRAVEFSQLRSLDIGTANEIAMLAHGLGQQKPNVKFLMS